jgi:hypothetical protein
MDAGFVALAFSFCAAMATLGGQDVVAFGYVSGKECVVHAYVGDSHGEMVTINGHSIGVEMLAEGAVVHVDDLQFTIAKTEGI